MAEATCTNLHAPRDAHIGREGFWPYGLVTNGRRFTDATRLTFPIQMVLVIAASAASATASVWAMNMNQRAAMLAMASDVRDIKTTMDGLTRYQGSQIDALRRDYDDLRREHALQKVRLEETRNTLAEVKGFLAGNGTKR